MTVEQDVRNLQALNADLERRLQEITDLVYLWKVNGAQDLFAEAGGQIYGGGVMRLDQNGIQIEADNDLERASIFWVPPDEFSNSPSTVEPRGTISGYAYRDVFDRAYVEVRADDPNGGTAFMHVESYGFSDDTFVRLSAKHANTSTTATQLYVYDIDATEKYVGILNGTLRLASFTADPSTLADGDLWYRSDTDEIRARINGSTVSLSTGGGAMKVQGDGYYTLPLTVGAGITVTPGSGSLGSWAEIEDSTAEAMYITHITIEDAAAAMTYARVQIGTGAAASETVVSEVTFGTTATGATGSYTYQLPYPIAVATSTRIALRAAASAASNLVMNLTVVAQADVVAM